MANQHTKKAESEKVEAKCKPYSTVAGKTDRIWDPKVSYKGDNDPVNNPEKYTSHPSGVECIQIVEHMAYNTGSAMRHLWTSETLGAPENRIIALRKAAWHIQREIGRLVGGK